MKAVEAKITEFLRHCIKGSRPEGLIRCEATKSSIGYIGSVKSGFLRASQDFHDILQATRSSKPSFSEFSDLIKELREVAVNAPNGRWYRCNIEIHPRQPATFHYFWENTPFDSVKELEPLIDGGVPLFVFERRFDKRLIEELSDSDVDLCVPIFVGACLSQSRRASPALLEVAATFDWRYDVIRNGGINYYFGLKDKWSADISRKELYSLTYHGLERIGHVEALRMFAQSIALYSKISARVEAARKALQIQPFDSEESEIMDAVDDLDAKIYESGESIRAAQIGYIRNQIAELEQ